MFILTKTIGYFCLGIFIPALIIVLNTKTQFVVKMQKAFILKKMFVCSYCCVLSMKNFIVASADRIHIPKKKRTVEASS
jgi:aerobic-type carbon monoxide dehydrogenase small subunit (CoxS/CutS family)